MVPFQFGNPVPVFSRLQGDKSTIRRGILHKVKGPQTKTGTIDSEMFQCWL